MVSCRGLCVCFGGFLVVLMYRGMVVWILVVFICVRIGGILVVLMCRGMIVRFSCRFDLRSDR